MRKIRIFVDGNILISGTFFSGLESKLLNLGGVELITADICVSEVTEVVRRKFKDLGTETQVAALEALSRSLIGVTIIPVQQYKEKTGNAKKLIDKRNDQRVLAAVLSVRPDYFISGDRDFHNEEIKTKVNLSSTRQILKDLNAI
ncbi:MAG: hypothetical protein JW778_05405 [Candidatus Altiarchaeota archaeon]|nr:hypothetical protein [Candidatus Altiarchaeota archaeon]